MTRSARVVLSLGVAARAASSQASPAAVPVHREPRHRLVHENPIARVLDVRVPPGDTTLFHEHDDRYVGVVISSARTWEQRLGGEPVHRQPNPVGTIFDNLALALPYTHRVGNEDAAPFRYVVAVVRTASGVDAPALTVEGLRLERETPYARAYRVTLAPGEATPAHRHAQPGLTVQVGEGSVRLDGDAARASSEASGAGAWWWRAAGARHALRNVGATPVDLVEFDWR